MAEPAAGHEPPSPFLKRRRDIPRCFGLTEARKHGVERAVDELQGCRVHQMKLKSYEPLLGGTLPRFLQHLRRGVDTDDAPGFPDPSSRRDSGGPPRPATLEDREARPHVPHITRYSPH